MRGCDANGNIDNSRYSAPVPWIGAYIVAGSLFCAGAMALDAYSGFRRRKFWFPNRFFSLNSTTFTMLAIATKIPVDLNTSMPRAVDQLTKLSGTVLLCTAMANSMPSLGDMDSLLSNVVAMGILVVTVAVNIGIQMGTGVIFSSFLPEHVVVMVLMLVLLVLTVSSALHIAYTKPRLEDQYRRMLAGESAAADGGAGAGEEEYSSEQKPIIPLDKLKVHLKGCCLMAHTSNPQFVLGRSATCTASGAFCLVGAVVLLQALLRALVLRGPATRFCSGDSDYGWSTPLVLATQVAAVVVGTVAPVYRYWFYAVNVRSIDRPEDWTCADEFTVEEYWVQRLKELIKFDGSGQRRPPHHRKIVLVGYLVRLQEWVVLASKFVRLLPVVPVHWLRVGGRMLMRRTESSLSPRRPPYDNVLKNYVLKLEGEDDLVRLITRLAGRETDKWIQKGRDSQPEALLQLIRDHSTYSDGFRHAGDFDGSGAPHLLSREPSWNCWSLPLVTLAAVAAALPGVERGEVDSLLRGVKEGLRFVMLVEEENLDAMDVWPIEVARLKDFAAGRRAAESVWRGLELDRKWHDQDLRSLASSAGKGIAEKLLDIAKQEVAEAVEEFDLLMHVHLGPWPERVMAANCMYRVCATVVQGQHPTDAHLFAWLRTAISDVLGACLTNLPWALYLESFSLKVEERGRGLRDVALALGEAEAILQILEQSAEVVSRLSYNTRYLDGWKNRSVTDNRGGRGTNFQQQQSSTLQPLDVCQICFCPGHGALSRNRRFEISYHGRSSSRFVQANQVQAGVGAPSFDPNWYPDHTGATHHMTPDVGLLPTPMEYAGQDQVHVGNGTGLQPIHHTSNSSLQTPIRSLIFSIPSSSCSISH